ncbi:lysophospholipid acyltransferase family protein [Henriciella litoralis]|uniref:lysophospholipid acyltransferase family protein n=1 Tax=Henriciella litoralis TaxID=568102 RepID=UPI0009FF2D9C|nr:lysophospholipid acyltransferase family protein [Henriciella litoralis]
MNKQAATDAPRIIEGGRWTFSRAWRLVATGISFSLFGLGGLIMALIWFPLINLFIRDKQKRARFARASVHRIWRIYIEIMRGLGVLTYEFEGAEKLRACRGTVVVANHPSLIDVVFLMGFMQHTRAVVKEGVWNNFFMSGVVRACNYIPNLGDPERLIEDCSDALRDGANLCIFPEGSRTPIEKRAKYQRGFAHVALQADAPVLLVAIEVTPPTLRKNEPWYSIPVKKPHWRIRVIDTIETAGEHRYKRSVLGVRALTQNVQKRIEEELKF